MDRLRELIHEIHRRSLWQVLGIYVVGGWVVFEVVQTLTEGLGLPGWFPALAFVLLLIGLPIVLATAFVQEGVTSDPEPEGPPQTGDSEERVAAPFARSLLTWRNALLGGIAAFALWGIVATGWVLSGGGIATPRAGEVPLDNALVRTVAVLPMANLSPDPDHAFFAEGMHEEILGTLSRIGDLTVISRQAVLQYRDSPKTMAEIGSDLGAGSLVESSVRRDGDAVRVTVQLIDAATDAAIWSENYDTTLTAGNIFAIQTKIAENIARALRATLTPIEHERIASRPTDDLDAYDYYSRGRAAYERYDLDGFEEAIRLFRRAIERDSTYGPAWAGLADGLRQRAGPTYAGTDYHTGGVLQWTDSAEVAARQAIALAPTRPEGYKAMAGATVYRQHYAETTALLRQALERDPSHWVSTYNLGYALSYSGQIDEAIRWFKKANRLDPLSTWPGTDLIRLYAHLGEQQIADRMYADHQARFPGSAVHLGTASQLEFYRGDAEAAYQLAVRDRDRFREDSRALAMLAQSAVAVGRSGEAKEAAAEALRMAPEPAEDGHNLGGRHVGAFLGYALMQTGDEDAGRAELERVLAYRQAEADRGVDNVALPWKMAAIQAALGNAEEALDLVEEAYEAGFQPGRGYPTMDPLLNSIRDHPRFQAVMQKSLADLEEMRRTIETEEIAAGER